MTDPSPLTRRNSESAAFLSFVSSLQPTTPATPPTPTTPTTILPAPPSQTNSKQKSNSSMQLPLLAPNVVTLPAATGPALYYPLHPPFAQAAPIPSGFVSKISLATLKPATAEHAAAANAEAATRLKQLKRYRESHNEVERRRRENINQVIGELATMVPDCYPGQSKGSILRKTADYIREIQRQQQNVAVGVKSESKESMTHCARCSIEMDTKLQPLVPNAITALLAGSTAGSDGPDNGSSSSSSHDKHHDDPSSSGDSSDGDSENDLSKRIKVEGDSCPIEAKPSNFEFRRIQSWQEPTRAAPSFISTAGTLPIA